ncbi:BMA-PTP-1, isoform b [Dirofilaria immitis]|nr:BMA-PTP-1, isoform b [Dirofilaria immitis]
MGVGPVEASIGADLGGSSKYSISNKINLEERAIFVDEISSMILKKRDGRTEYQTMEEMRRRARVERTFLRHSSRDSQTMMNGNSLGPRDCASSCKTTSPVIASRIFCRSQICLRKWLGGRLRSASPSSSTMMTITTSRAEGTATSIGTLDNSLQFTGCTLPRSNLSPMSSAVTSNSSSKFQQLETSNVIAVAQEKNTDSCGDKNAKVSSKIGNSSVTEQRRDYVSHCSHLSPQTSLLSLPSLQSLSSFVVIVYILDD